MTKNISREISIFNSLDLEQIEKYLKNSYWEDGGTAYGDVTLND